MRKGAGRSSTARSIRPLICIRAASISGLPPPKGLAPKALGKGMTSACWLCSMTSRSTIGRRFRTRSRASLRTMRVSQVMIPASPRKPPMAAKARA
ncbi:hypothetical protein D3C87_1639760 [compost metagenome]